MYEAIKVNGEWRVRVLSTVVDPMILPKVYRSRRAARKAARTFDGCDDIPMRSYLQAVDEFKQREGY